MNNTKKLDQGRGSPAKQHYPALPEEKRAKPYVPAGGDPGYDGQPPAFRMRKDHVYADGKREETECPHNLNFDRVENLYSRDRIDERQYLAARRLQRDWELSEISPRASSVLVGAGGVGDMHPNDAKRAAMQRHGDAREALGPGWPLVELVVEKHKSVEKAAADLRIHRQVASGQLWMALHMLADHYKLPREIKKNNPRKSATTA